MNGAGSQPILTAVITILGWKTCLIRSKMATKNDALRGGALIPAVSIGREYEKPILTLIRRLSDDIRREMRRVFAESQHHGAMDDDKGAGAAEVGRSEERRVGKECRSRW